MIKIDVHFPLREYAGRNEEGKVETIPSPNRLVSAFLATSCEDEDFLQAVKTLEGNNPEAILQDSCQGMSHTPPVFQYKKTAFDIKKDLSAADESAFLSGGARSSALQKNISRTPFIVYEQNPTVTYVYSNIEDENLVVEKLSQQSGKIGYIGRSFNPVIVHVEKIDNIPHDSRLRYAPAPRGESIFVPSAGYVDYMKQRYHSEFGIMPLPFHLMKKSYYAPLRVREDGKNFVTVTISSVKNNWGEKLRSLQETCPNPIVPLINPGNYLHGFSVEVDNSDIADFVLGVMDNFGEDVIQSDHFKIGNYIDSYDSWKSYTPVLLRKNSAMAEVKVLADIVKQTNLSIEDIDVSLTPILYDKNKFPAPLGKKTPFYEWNVHIHSRVPIQGPLLVGEYTDYGYGRMIHDDTIS